MSAPIAVASSAYEDATAAAERQYERDLAVAKERRAEALESAREAFQAVLDAESPDGIQITVRYTGPGSTGTAKP